MVGSKHSRAAFDRAYVVEPPLERVYQARHGGETSGLLPSHPGPTVRERPRIQLERLVQQLERDHSDWDARRIESELALLAPAVYGSWKDDTPTTDSRLRQIQRWRRGYRSPPRPVARLPFRYLWPIGERQRHAVDPGYVPSPHRARASRRVFLQNVSDETVREVRATLGGQEVSYEPALLAKQFASILWTRNPAIRQAAVASAPHARLPFPLKIEFAVAKGTRRATLEGQLLLDSDDGWVTFTSADGQTKEIE
jgi:hypothetical protein